MDVGQLWVKLGLDKSNFDKGIKDTKSESQSFGSFLKNAFSFTVGQGMFDLIKQGLRSAWDMSMGFNSQMQQNDIAFTSMLGSAERSKALLGELADMAANTPFELPQLTDASKKLLAFGFSASKIPSMLKSIGDASSGLGLGAEGLSRVTIALGQIQAKGKVTAQEMMQLTEAGIPAWDILAKSMGKSTVEVMKLSEQGLIPAGAAINELLAGMEERFPNMMDKQSKSFLGLMSTLKDNVQMTLGDILRPAFEYLSNTLLPAAIEKTNQLREAFKLDGIKGVLNELFPPELAAIINGIGVAVKETFGFITEHGTLIKGVLYTIVGGWVAVKGAAIASRVATEAMNLVTALSIILSKNKAAADAMMAFATEGATIAQWALNAAMEANPIGLVIGLIGALTGALFGFGAMADSAKEKQRQLSEEIRRGYMEEQNKQIEALNKYKQAEQEAINDRRSTLDKEHNEFIKNLDSKYGAYKSTEKNMTDIAREESEKRKSWLDKEYNRKIKLEEETSNKKIEELEAQIEAIDNQTKQEEKAEKDLQNAKKLEYLKNKAAYSTNLIEKAQAQSELAKFEVELEKEKIEEQREKQKKALKDQIDQERKASKDKVERLREELQNEKDAVDRYTEHRISKLNEERKAFEDAENAKYEASKKTLDKQEKDLTTWHDYMVNYVKKMFEDLAKNSEEEAKKKLEKEKNTSSTHEAATTVMHNRYGIPKHAKGTDYFEGGLTWVNEEGGEIVDLPQGTRIIPHDVSMEMAKNTGGKGVVQNFNISNFNVMDKGDQKRTLAQLQFLAQY